MNLSALPPDEHGPIARVNIEKRTRSWRTLANREFLAWRGAQLLRAAGARKVVRVDLASLMLHVQSTMRMGESPFDSVVDPTGEARRVRGLFIADNASLSNSCGGANPTLTTQAIATRTAERIFQRYFGGDPWVGREAPVPTTDDRISAALAGRG